MLRTEWTFIGLAIGMIGVALAAASTIGSNAVVLMFIAPPLASILAWWFYNDQLSSLQLVGFAVTLVGVYLARK